MKKMSKIKKHTTNSFRKKKVHKVEDWATEFLGRSFDTNKAKKAGWITHDSPQYTYGLPRAKNLWVYKIEENECGCPHIVWRYVFVLITPKKQIENIFSMIFLIGHNGGSEMLSTELMPGDVVIAQEKLKRALNHKRKIVTKLLQNE